MTPFIVVGSVLVVIAVGMLVTLVIRHEHLAREDLRIADAELRLRPVAIEMLEGTAAPPPLSPADQVVLATVVGRYSRKVSGSTSVRIGEYFSESGAFATARDALHSRRSHRRAAAPPRRRAAAPPRRTVTWRARRPFRCSSAPSRTSEATCGPRPCAASGACTTRPSRALVESLVADQVPRGMGASAPLEPGPGAAPELCQIASHEDPEVRAIALRVLGLVGQSADAGVALAALDDPDPDVRAAAARALTRIGTSAAEPRLTAALDDAAHFVRAEAAGALGAIHARAALPRLLEMARTDDFRPARAAAPAVSAIDPRALSEAAARPGAGAHLHEAADLMAL